MDSRDVDTIDGELELLAAVAASIRRLGGTPSIALIDERIATRSGRQPKHRRRSAQRPQSRS